MFRRGIPSTKIQILTKIQYSLATLTCSMCTDSAIRNSMFGGKSKIQFSNKAAFN